MLHSGLGKAKGALILATARQGTCFFPLLPVLYYAGGAYGLAAVQAAADLVSLFLALPLRRRILGEIREAARTSETSRTSETA